MTHASYSEDFFLWAEGQAALLRDGRFDALDVPNLVEEVEGLARSERRQLHNRLRVLLRHLLKWRYQAERRASSTWSGTIIEQRRRIELVLQESPSLSSLPAEVLQHTYDLARTDTHRETGLPLATFPEVCPYTIEEVLDSDFWPA